MARKKIGFISILLRNRNPGFTITQADFSLSFHFPWHAELGLEKP